MSAGARPDGPMVLPRAFALMRLLAGGSRKSSLTDMAAQLDVPKSSLSSTLKALVGQGYLAREGALYSLGPQSFALASAILAGKTISQIAGPSLQKAMEACGESVLLATPDPDGAHMTYIAIAESPSPVRYAVPVGTRRPLYATACGKLFLGERDEDARRAYYEATPLEQMSELTVTDPETLEAQIRTLRETGVSITDGEYSADAVGFAAPVRGPAGVLVAALVIAAPISRGRRETARFAQLAAAAAAEISGILGGVEREDESAAG